MYRQSYMHFESNICMMSHIYIQKVLEKNERINNLQCMYKHSYMCFELNICTITHIYIQIQVEW